MILDQDLTCTGNGLTVGADGIKINLNGHTITGPGSSIALVRGISLNQRNSVSIRGGTIRNFESGVFVANSSEITIKEILFAENREGVFLNGSSASTVKENTAWRNQIRGIMVRPSATRSSTDNVIKENLVVENPVGILVFGQPRNTLKENRISWSSQAGILLTGSGASGNLVKENTIGSSAAGIEFAVGGWTRQYVCRKQDFIKHLRSEGPLRREQFPRELARRQRLRYLPLTTLWTFRQPTRARRLQCFQCCGVVAASQDSYNHDAARACSIYDRPIMQ